MTPALNAIYDPDHEVVHDVAPWDADRTTCGLAIRDTWTRCEWPGHGCAKCVAVIVETLTRRN